MPDENLRFYAVKLLERDEKIKVDLSAPNAIPYLGWWTRARRNMTTIRKALSPASVNDHISDI